MYRSINRLLIVLSLTTLTVVSVHFDGTSISSHHTMARIYLLMAFALPVSSRFSIAGTKILYPQVNAERRSCA
jgi:hypothetical protein